MTTPQQVRAAILAATDLGQLEDCIETICREQLAQAVVPARDADGHTCRLTLPALVARRRSELRATGWRPSTTRDRA